MKRCSVAVAMLLAPADEQTLVVRAGVFGNKIVVLCCERVPRRALRELQTPQPAQFFGAGAAGRGGEATAESILDVHPYDELRVLSHFDSRRPAVRSAKRPMTQANSSGSMASLLMGEHYNGELTGQHVPAVGQHVMSASGATKPELSGGLGMLAKDQRCKLVHGTHTQWTQAFEMEVQGAGKSANAADVLELRYGSAMATLRDHSVSPTFHRYQHNGRTFAAVQGDVEGGAVVARVLEAMREACLAIERDG